MKLPDGDKEDAADAFVTEVLNEAAGGVAIPSPKLVTLREAAEGLKGWGLEGEQLLTSAAWDRVRFSRFALSTVELFSPAEVNGEVNAQGIALELSSRLLGHSNAGFIVDRGRWSVVLQPILDSLQQVTSESLSST